MQYANDHSCGTSAFFMNMSMAWHVLVWHKCLLPPCQMTRDAAMRLCNEAVAGEIVLNPQRLQLLQKEELTLPRKDQENQLCVEASAEETRPQGHSAEDPQL